jgi:hypothetical protein
MRAAPTLALVPVFDTGSDWQTNLASVANYAWTGIPTVIAPADSMVIAFRVSHASMGTDDHLGAWVQPYVPTGEAANYITFDAEL